MPKRRPRKSDAIRELLTMSPEMRNSEIIAALAAKKIKVSAAHISNLRKAMAAGKGRRTPARPPAAKDRVSLAALMEAMRLADRLGGVDRAAELFRTLAALRG